LLLLGAACSNLSVPGSKAPPTDADVTELAPGSLRIPVLEYSWHYLPGNDHIQLQGTVVNGEERPVQSVIIAVVLHDQDGAPIAYGETYVAPSYLVPGAKGTFSILALIKRKKGVTYTRLISNAQSQTRY
jgi:hypothetical protein